MSPLLVLLFTGFPKPLPHAFLQAQAAQPGIEQLVKQVESSGRVLCLVPQPEDKIRIAPGAPPLLAFRYLEGRQKGRFGGLDLVLDDAGH
ncbi:MAG TPA: hypothetical protein VE621_05680 [Bryobacteraceae bacterium]|jgi:hypothetical protein|nr:hypothetical protein [Bryobacteraceae bacterium]